MSFLTAGEPEVRAWTIKKGTKAPEAAGKIHSDIQRGFIRAEIVSYDDLIKERWSNEQYKRKRITPFRRKRLYYARSEILFYLDLMYKYK